MIINTFGEWVRAITDSDNLCAEYHKRLVLAKSTRQIMDIVLDCNGVSFLQEMQKIGLALPYEVITSKFGGLINGKYIADFKNEKSNGYTSTLYCCFQGEIEANTTLLSLLGCKATIYVKPNNVVKIYADKNCDLNIACPSSSKCYVYYWGDKEPEYSGEIKMIKM